MNFTTELYTGIILTNTKPSTGTPIYSLYITTILTHLGIVSILLKFRNKYCPN